MAPRILVLTGEIGIGKTTVCERAVAGARTAGLRLAGILSRPVWHDGRKVAVDAEDLATGRRRRLAETRDGVGSSQEGPATAGWQFSAEALAWGERVIHAAVPCSVLVLDELGPLELIRGVGWVSALDVLAGGRYQVALVVVRSSLLERFEHMLPGAEIRVLEVSESNRDALPSQIVAELREALK